MARVELLATGDPYTDLRPGDRGELIRSYIDPWGDRVIDVRWDTGSNLSLIRGEDSWRVVAEDTETTLN